MIYMVYDSRVEDLLDRKFQPSKNTHFQIRSCPSQFKQGGEEEEDSQGQDEMDGSNRNIYDDDITLSWMLFYNYM